MSHAFEYRTLKKPSKLRNEEDYELLYDVDYTGDLKLRHEDLIDLNKPARLAGEARAREKKEKGEVK